HITATTTSANCASYPNTARVSSTNDGPDSSQLATETVQCPVVTVTKTADHADPVSAGDTIGFTVSVINSGDGAAAGVTLNDSLPGGNAATPVTWVKDTTTGNPASFALSTTP